MLFDTFVIIRGVGEGRDVYGRVNPNPAIELPCSIVKLLSSTEKTTVRTDSGATLGSADEAIVDTVLLIHPSYRWKLGDLLSLKGFELELITGRPRFDAFGDLDHIEIGCRECRQ